MSDIFVLLIAAVTVVSIFRLFKASPVHGYLMAGLLIGPHSLAFIANIHTVKILGEFGVVFLLFTLGLKMPLQRLQVLRRYVFGLGFLQVFLTATLIGTIAYMMGASLVASIVIGNALSLSSTAVAMQVLGERGEFAQRYGRVAFAILLSQDLAVVLLLILQTKLTAAPSNLIWDLTLSAGKVLLVLTAIILIGRLILRPIYRIIARFDNPELFVTFTLLVVLTTSMATEFFGLSMELGAFLAGLLLSETEYRHQVEADIQPFYGLLIGLFFISVGMAIDLSLIVSHAPKIIAITLGLLTLKTGVIFALCRLFKTPVPSSLRVGLLLAPGGEFVFVLFAPMVVSGLIDNDLAQLLYAVIVITMALTPFLATLGKAIAERWLDQENDAHMKAKADEVGDLKNHVIIAGYGRVGRLVTRILTEQMVPLVIVDNDMNCVTEGKAQGLPIFYGDVRRIGVMRTLGAKRARSIMVNLSGVKPTVQATYMLRRQFPNAEVCVRLRDDKYVEKLTKIGAHIIVPENIEPSLKVAASVLETTGRSPQEVEQIINTFRKSYSSVPQIAEEIEDDIPDKEVSDKEIKDKEIRDREIKDNAIKDKAAMDETFMDKESFKKESPVIDTPR